MTTLAGVAAALLALAVLVAPASAQTRGFLDAEGALRALNCSACHGPGGNSPSNTMPILAGMDQAYFRKQIEAYAAGRRLSPEMQPYAKQVLEFGVNEIATYFALQPRRPTPIKADPAAVERGRTASTRCVACHGPNGKGDPAKGVPDLTGQPPGYLLEQMVLFKADRRSPGDPALTELKAVLKPIPDDTLADLAAYYSSLR